MAEGSEIAAAWKEFINSNEGGQLTKASTLGKNADYYLTNRLWRAFMAGVKAAEEIAAKQGRE